jgi:pyruvate-formate lyase-activating enzyme
MVWTCAAIDHGVTIFPDGRIGPCCQIAPDALKPITELSNPDRFAELRTESAPASCNRCSQDEYNGIDSYRKFFNNTVTEAPGLQFVDIRNTNVCNLKCRYCGPHFSNQWAEELGYAITIKSQELINYQSDLITDSLQWMYFTGGEPLINPEHWRLLERLIDEGRAGQVSLLYNTNLTTLKYKDKNISDIWKQFKSVAINCSIDAVGEPLESIRSGASWNKIESNLKSLLDMKTVAVTLTPVLSILNIWFVEHLFAYAQQHTINVDPIVLEGPDYLCLNCIPDSLKTQALSCVDRLKNYNVNDSIISCLYDLINNNQNQCLFLHTVSHVLLLDQMRNEQLFELLPFRSFAVDNLLKNYEY